MRFYEESKPIPTDEGLRAKRVSADGWWADRWVETLETLLDAGRLRRGRRYARSGQVLDLAVAPGEARARVQGSRDVPYEVTIRSEPLSDAQWERVTELLAGRALYAAQLLAGEVPREIEAVFEEADAALLPASADDLAIACSCPDWAPMCKHGAALAYLLGERFDEDPFALFLLRGRGRDELLAALAPQGDADAAGDAADLLPPPRPLSDDPASFWTGSAPPAVPEPAAPAVQAHLLRRAGPFGGEDLRASLGPSYEHMSELALALWRGSEEERP